MNVLGIIPARYGSTRLEGKPLLDIGGKTMIQRVYEQASKALEHVYVATDDVRIEKEVLSFGGKVVMTDESHSTGTNRCLEAFDMVQNNCDHGFDAVINIQGDEPLLDPQHIHDLVNCFNDSTTSMATLIMPIKNGSELIPESDVYVVINNNQNALYFSREVIPHVRNIERKNWTDHHTYYKHIGMYGFTPEAIHQFAGLQQTNLEKAESLEQNRWLEHGFQIKAAITDHDSISVDTMRDLEIVRQIVKAGEN